VIRRVVESINVGTGGFYDRLGFGGGAKSKSRHAKGFPFQIVIVIVIDKIPMTRADTVSAFDV